MHSRVKLFYQIIVILFFISILNAKYINIAYVRSSKLNIRKNPSTKSQIVGKLKRGTKVVIISKKRRWFKVIIPNLDNLTGWVYYSGLFKRKKIYIPDYKIDIKFNNFNDTFRKKVLEFKRYLNFDFYKKDIEIIFSYEKELNKLAIFIKTEFFLDYYNKNKDTSLKNNEIDLYPYLNFAYIIDKFIKKIAFKYPACGEFLRKFSIDIVLTKSPENFIIIDIYRKNKLYKFSPYIIINTPGYDMVKIYTENKEKLEKSYIFELEPPYYTYGIKSTSFLLYEFFGMLKG